MLVYGAAMREQWRPIPTMPGYEASDRGRVRSWRLRWPSLRDEPILRQPQVNKRGGYLYLTFNLGGANFNRYIHHLVMAAFGRRRRKPGQEVRHRDGNPANNSLSNLIWGSHIRNMRDQLDHGTHTRGSRNGNAKLTLKQVAIIRRSPLSTAFLAQRYGVCNTTITRVKSGARYAH